MNQSLRKPERGYFVTGTDTEVGKTFVACRRIEDMRAQGMRVGAYKPVASGAVSVETSDGYRLWRAVGQLGPLERVNPQSFDAPLAPPIAADLEHRTVEESRILSGVEAWFDACDWLVVEGAGGLMSPITWNWTNADLADQLGYPLVLVAANRLGAVHHVLSSVSLAVQRRLTIAEIVLNEPEGMGSNLAATTNSKLLRPFLDRLCPGVPLRCMKFEPAA
jgi:dethiobiotin synthetase